MEKELITVIIPVYNAKKYLKRCIDSILAQTYSKIEIILINDGSSDNSQKICEEYEKKYHNVKLINKENEGAGLARNTGLEFANSNYVAFVDADDYIDSKMYEILYENMINSGAQACFCGSKKINEERIEINKKVENIIMEKKDILEKSIPYICSGEMSEDILMGAVALWHGLYDLRIINQFQIRLLSEREYISEDTIFNLHYFLHCDKIKFVNQYLYYEYITPNSVSRGYKPKEIAKFEKFYDYVSNFITENHIPNAEKNIQLLNRRYLNLYKHTIAKEVKLNSDKSNITKNIKDMCEADKILQRIIIKREYGKITWKEKICAELIHYKLYFLFRKIFG